MKPAPTPQSLNIMLRPVAVASVAVAIVFLGGFSVWSIAAPLSSAAIAPGIVSPESSRKTIQHLEGGIVREILVREGGQVEAGDVLMRLSPTQAQARFNARQRQWFRLEAQRERLQALEIGREELRFSAAIVAVTDTDFQEFVLNQQSLFAFQRRSLSEKRSIVGHRIAQIGQEIAAIERVNEGLAEQLAIIKDEIADKEQLLAKKLLRKPEVLVLRRARADLKSRIASNEATVARAEQRIDELRLGLLSLDTEFRDSVAKELMRVNSELADLEEAMVSSEDVFARTEIRAATSGTVLNLRIGTIGGVVRPGEPILDLVPTDEDLLIEARLSPNDIDVVASGQAARIHLTPFAARHMPALDGTLVHISSDSIMDETTRERYYELRIRVEPTSLARLAANIVLLPGMPAEVYIATGEQSLFRYLAAPVTRSFRRAFREG